VRNALRWLWASCFCLVLIAETTAQSIDYPSIVKAATEDHAISRFGKVVVDGEKFQTAVEDACEDPASFPTANLISAYSALVLSWEGAQHMRWGPARVDYRHERLSFGADPKNYAGRQLYKLMTKGGLDTMELTEFQEQSVAIQGLTAFEQLMQSPFADEKLQNTRCRAASLIAHNVAGITSEMYSDWLDEDGYRAELATPGPDNPKVKTHQEAANNLFKPLAGALRFAIDIRLKDPMQSEVARARPSYVAYHRTQLSNKAFLANLAALEDLYINGGFSSATSDFNDELDARIKSLFTAVQQEFLKLKMPLHIAIKQPEEREQIREITKSLDELWSYIVFDMAELLGLQVGFNEFDGD